jgi:hypothetical protein
MRAVVLIVERGRMVDFYKRTKFREGQQLLYIQRIQ